MYLPRLAIASLLLTAACATDKPSTPLPPAPANCENADGALSTASFVIAEKPVAGARVSPGFAVSGCSRTFESTVVWRLLGRDGTVLANGATTGGGVDGFGPFSFTITYAVPERQIGHLEVFEEDASDGEGFPPGKTVLPLVLQP
ncbi:Gmad2 immunoglobulin-like domain-containing protein [Rhodobacteraceae bacterium NNCM2]|nr:Gmad2 immunoglobulin-like domain-containing protein [Coraliihabitans acroporae]